MPKIPLHRIQEIAPFVAKMITNGTHTAISTTYDSTNKVINFAVLVDDTGIEVNGSNKLQLKDLGVKTAKIDNLAVTTGKINTDAVDKTKINVDVAGAGLSQAGDGALQIAFLGERSDPTGFPNRDDTSLSFVDNTRTFTITGTNFKIWINGVEYTKNTENIVIANSTGMHWVYYDSSGTLATSTAFPGWHNATIASIYYNTAITAGLVGEERHGLTMDNATHDYLHDTVGTRYDSGLAGSFTDTTFSISSGNIHDEDIHFEIGTQTTCRVLYKDGSAEFKWTAGQAEYYYESGGNIYYNNGNTLTAMDSNKYVAYWIFASNNDDFPVIALMGQSQDNTLAAARNNNRYESLELGTLPFGEFKLLYRVILRNDVTPYEETQDLRSVSNVPAGTYVATDHEVLTNLNSANHYHLTQVEYGYIDQDVTSGSSPTFDGTNFSGIPNTALTVGITDDDLVEIDSASVASGEYAKFTANGLESKSYAEVKTDLSLDNVENLKVKLDATAAPTVNNDVDEGYTVGSRWFDITNDKEYVCLDNTDGATVWLETTASAGSDIFGSQLLHIQDQKAANTHGGTFTLGAWRTRDLNTVLTNEISGASLSTNVITLPVGTYYCDGSAPCYQVRGHKARLYKTNGTPVDLIIGLSGFVNNTSAALGYSFITGRFTISEESTIELQHRSNYTKATNGFGVRVNLDSKVEVYSDIRIWKIS